MGANTMAINAEMVSHISLFHLLDNDELAELSAHIDEATYNAQQIIYKAGDPGTNMQIVLEGGVQTYLTDDEGQHIIISDFEKGEMFGEFSFLDMEVRSSSAVATAPTRTFIIDRDDLQRLFAKKPAAALDIMAILG